MWWNTVAIVSEIIDFSARMRRRKICREDNKEREKERDFRRLNGRFSSEKILTRFRILSWKRLLKRALKLIGNRASMQKFHQWRLKLKRQCLLAWRSLPEGTRDSFSMRSKISRSVHRARLHPPDITPFVPSPVRFFASGGSALTRAS